MSFDSTASKLCIGQCKIGKPTLMHVDAIVQARCAYGLGRPAQHCRRPSTAVIRAAGIARASRTGTSAGPQPRSTTFAR